MSIIGIDIGGTKCAVSRRTAAGGVEEVARFATRGWRETLDEFFRAVEKLPEAGTAPAFGISCGSPQDSRRGLILSPPNLPGWERVPVCAEFVKRFGGQAWLMNDANACALAEWQFGAGRGCRSMIFLTMGTGMGAGLILDGRLYEGVTGNAGEAGHVRLAPDGPLGYGKRGSFEGFCSGGGIAQLAQAAVRARGLATAFGAARTEEITARHLGEAARAGDALAREIWGQVGARLGEALAVLVDVLNPERIVIGSIYPRCREFIEPAMQAALRREALAASLADCRVAPAELGEAIGNYGAVAVARYYLEIAG